MLVMLDQHPSMTTGNGHAGEKAGERVLMSIKLSSSLMLGIRQSP
jgi:hypothetical protein